MPADTFPFQWFSQFGVEEPDKHDFNRIHHHWGELDHSQLPGLDLADALVAEWEEIPTARLNMWNQKSVLRSVAIMK